MAELVRFGLMVVYRADCRAADVPAVPAEARNWLTYSSYGWPPELIGVGSTLSQSNRPFARMGQQLGDLGADVVKIEPPDGDTTRQLGKANVRAPLTDRDNRAPHWSYRFPECLREQSAVISSDQSNSLASTP
jgi:hypothetical protein